MKTERLILICLIIGTLLGSQVHCFRKPRRELICPVDTSTSEGFHYTALPNGTGSLSIIGDVNHVLQGLVTPGTESNVWNGINIGPFGFGAAAIGPSLGGLGEALFVNGHTAIRQTDNGTANYFQTVVGQEFRTSFAVFVGKDAQPDGKVEFYTKDNARNITIMEFYSRLHKSVNNQPFCFYGLTQFSQLDGVAVSKAPIYGEPLFGDLLAGYYTQPNFELPNEYGITFGCAANFSTVQDSVLVTRLRKLLYVNPLDPGSSSNLQVHSHALTVRRCLENPEEINTASILDVYHLLSNATFSHINAKVFVLNTRDKITELSHPLGNSSESLKQKSASDTPRSWNFLILSLILVLMSFHNVLKI